jgi:carboxyl-terminal processing protease
MLFAALAVAPMCQGQTDTASRLSLEERIYMASRVYATVEAYFIAGPPPVFDDAYQHYISSITGTDDRRAFDLATMRLLAVLHSGHSWFDDQWLESHDGGALGFYAEPVQDHWTVMRSTRSDVRVGDVISAIDGTAMEAFYQDARPYLMDSDERSARLDLFNSPYLLPKSFIATFADHRTVRITRGPSAGVSPDRERVEGKWLEPDRIAYIRIPTFAGIVPESDALALVRQFRNARGLIIDLRGNPGGFGNPHVELLASLMDRPFRAWRESLGRFTSSSGNLGQLVSGNAYIEPPHGMDQGVFTGRLVLLVDRGCASFCEDFVMPFKDNHRATVIGDTTAGTYAQTHYTAFANGMRLSMALTRVVFPNGNTFEGVGIAPDVAVTPTVDDIRAHTDVELQRALVILRASQ